jgi:sortase (surface protein transpeptidase)
LDGIITDESTVWHWLDILPKVLPKTWTPISQRIKKSSNSKLSLELPAGIWKLAWNNNDDIEFWKKWVEEQDRNRNEYIVIPSNWLVVPINEIPSANVDYTKLISWHEIDVNKYLKSWVLKYAWASINDYGKPWNTVIFWHSSYWKKDDGRYKTQFQKIIELDPLEEIWVYKKIDWNFKRFRYIVEKSYNTPQSDVSVLKPWVWSNLTLFTCTPIWWVQWRWIIKARYFSEDKETLEDYIYWNSIWLQDKNMINNIISKIHKIDNNKKTIILTTYNKIEEIVAKIWDKNSKSNEKYDMLNYLKLKLAIEYFN